MPKKVLRDQMQLRMEPTLVDAVRVYADLVRERTGVRTVSVAEATRMAIRAGLVAAGVDPDDPRNEAAAALAANGISAEDLRSRVNAMAAETGPRGGRHE